MSNNVEIFFDRRRLKIRRDGVEFGVRCPGSARGKPLASFFELTLAYVVLCINEMELMVRSRALK